MKKKLITDAEGLRLMIERLIRMIDNISNVMSMTDIVTNNWEELSASDPEGFKFYLVTLASALSHLKRYGQIAESDMPMINKLIELLDCKEKNEY